MDERIKKWQRYREYQRATMKAIDENLRRLEEDARKVPKPKNLRPAKSDDVKVGAIFWHAGDCLNRSKFRWFIVEDVLKCSYGWRNFVATGGGIL